VALLAAEDEDEFDDESDLEGKLATVAVKLAIAAVVVGSRAIDDTVSDGPFASSAVAGGSAAILGEISDSDVQAEDGDAYEAAPVGASTVPDPPIAMNFCIFDAAEQAGVCGDYMDDAFASFFEEANVAAVSQTGSQSCTARLVTFFVAFLAVVQGRCVQVIAEIVGSQACVGKHFDLTVVLHSGAAVTTGIIVTYMLVLTVFAATLLRPRSSVLRVMHDASHHGRLFLWVLCCRQPWSPWPVH